MIKFESVPKPKKDFQVAEDPITIQVRLENLDMNHRQSSSDNRTIRVNHSKMKYRQNERGFSIGGDYGEKEGASTPPAQNNEIFHTLIEGNWRGKRLKNFFDNYLASIVDFSDESQRDSPGRRGYNGISSD